MNPVPIAGEKRVERCLPPPVWWHRAGTGQDCARHGAGLGVWGNWGTVCSLSVLESLESSCSVNSSCAVLFGKENCCFWRNTYSKLKR